MNDLEFIVLGLIFNAGMNATYDAEDVYNTALSAQCLKHSLAIRKVILRPGNERVAKRGWGYELWSAPTWSEEDFTFLDGSN